MFSLGNILGPGTAYGVRTREAITNWRQNTFPSSIQDLENRTKVEDISALECLTDITRESLNNNVYAGAYSTTDSISLPHSNSNWLQLATIEASNRIQREQHEQQSQIYEEMVSRGTTTGNFDVHLSHSGDIRFDKETDDIQIFVEGGWVSTLTSKEMRVKVELLAQTILDKLAEPELQAKEIRRSLSPNIEEDAESFADLI